MQRLRMAVVVGPVIIAVFMVADMSLLPRSLYGLYLENRLLFQFPAVALTVVVAFQDRFEKYLKLVFSALLLWLTFTNFALIYHCWRSYQFAFPYEGTILYAFYCVFALRIPSLLTLISCSLIMAGFLALLSTSNIYGERGPISAAFVAGGLFICVYAKYRLDNSLRRLNKVNRQLKRLSTLDSLTGIYNRRALMDASDTLLSSSAQEGQAFAVLLLDLDDFKKYNDAFGHQKGDEAIAIQADILQQVFHRDTDVIGRYGGEEFMVASSGMTETDTEQKCQELAEQWQQRSLTHLPTVSPGYMTCSVGVAYCHNCGTSNLRELIHQADQALYRVKSQAKGHYHITCVTEAKVKPEKC